MGFCSNALCIVAVVEEGPVLRRDLRLIASFSPHGSKGSNVEPFYALITRLSIKLANESINLDVNCASKFRVNHSPAMIPYFK
jgi:hypothetical protein